MTLGTASDGIVHVVFFQNTSSSVRSGSARSSPPGQEKVPSHVVSSAKAELVMYSGFHSWSAWSRHRTGRSKKEKRVKIECADADGTD